MTLASSHYEGEKKPLMLLGVAWETTIRSNFLNDAIGRVPHVRGVPNCQLPLEISNVSCIYLLPSSSPSSPTNTTSHGDPSGRFCDRF